MSGIQRYAKVIVASVASVAGVALLAGAFTSGGGGEKQARAVLLAAVAKTEATNFRMTPSGTDASRSGVSDFEAPDRLRVSGTALPGPEVSVAPDGSVAKLAGPQLHGGLISIGRDVYRRDGSPAGGYIHTVQPADAPVTPIAFLGNYAKTGTVTRKGDRFTIALRGSNRVDVQISRGYIVAVKMTIASPPSTPGFTLSHFGQRITIEAPPADQVHEKNSLNTQTTGKGRSQDNVTLPSPHGDTTTTLQFREVASNVANCPASAENPSPTTPATIQRSEGGSCLATGPSLIEIRHARGTAGRDSDDHLYVQFQLSSADANAFDRMAAAHQGRQIAIVAFGQVLSAPTVNSRSYNGKVTITGNMPPEFAARLVAALK